MSLVLWLLVPSLYVAVWLATALTCAGMLASRERCHAHYEWNYRDSCERHDGPGCWRSDNRRPSVEESIYGCLMALVWPLVLPALGVYALGGRGRRVRLLSADELARLEREAGIAA